MVNKIKIVSTKKLLPYQKQVLLEANFDLFDDDFIQTKIKSFESSQSNENLIFTSQKAVQSVLLNPRCDELKDKNVFAVGIQTKKILTENGFNVVFHTNYASDLAKKIIQFYNKGSYTFFCGNLRHDILPDLLKENSIAIDEIEVYETQLTSKKVKENQDGILFFSPSAVESYLKMNTIRNETCFSIGKTTSDSIHKRGIKNYVTAKKPSIDEVIKEVINVFSK
jgi:uroporphyrinogen-III synthase